MIDNVAAIQSLRPLAQFAIYENKITWLDKAQSEPTTVEIATELKRLQANETYLQQILTLESQQTPRLLREAVSGVAFAVKKLATIDADIAALRSTLT